MVSMALRCPTTVSLTARPGGSANDDGASQILCRINIIACCIRRLISWVNSDFELFKQHTLQKIDSFRSNAFLTERNPRNSSLTTLHIDAITGVPIVDINLTQGETRYGSPWFSDQPGTKTAAEIALRQPRVDPMELTMTNPKAFREGRVRRDRHRIWPHRRRHLGCNHRRRAGPRLEVEHDLSSVQAALK